MNFYEAVNRFLHPIALAAAPEIPYLKWIALTIVVGYSAWMVWKYCDFSFWKQTEEDDD